MDATVLLVMDVQRGIVEVLLRGLGAGTLVLAGIATSGAVLSTPPQAEVLTVAEWAARAGGQGQ